MESEKITRKSKPIVQCGDGQQLVNTIAHADSDSLAGDVLCYADQGSFMGLRALGRGPVHVLTWFFSDAIDEKALDQLNKRLAQTLLGRRIQTSAWPWGRHRWVAQTTPAPVTWANDPIPVENWHEAHCNLIGLSIDPENGPSWRMTVQTFVDGGCALSLLVSHTIADGMLVIQSVNDAIEGRMVTPSFPMASSRWSLSRLARDVQETLHALPNVGRALRAAIQRARAPSALADLQRPTAHTRGHSQDPASIVPVPLVQMVMDRQSFKNKATELGVNRSAVFAALAARIAQCMGRVDSSGNVKLTMPVSNRQPGDRRGNALQSITLHITPNSGSPQMIDKDMKSALHHLKTNGDDLSPLFPLIPFIPIRLARHLERIAIGTEKPVGCSILGDLPQALINPCGVAEHLQYCYLEKFTVSDLAHLDGILLLIGYSAGEKTMASIVGYKPGIITTRADFYPVVRSALTDLGLDAELK